MFGFIGFALTILGLTSAYTNEALQDQVTNLPGLDVTSIPQFNQFSGYLTFGSKHIHYWFVEAIESPSSAPLVFWTNGGPGCSGLLGFLTEQGPFRPTEDGLLEFNKWTWNQKANMVFIEQPVGVGFSYSDNSSDYRIGDDQTALDNVQVILQFISKFPEYSKTPIYLTAESYGGHYIPTWADAILDYNYANPKNLINLAGFAVGNPYVDYWSGVGAQMEAYWDHQLLPSNLWDIYVSNGCTNAVGYLNNSVCSSLTLDFMRKINSINPYALDYPVCLDTQEIHMLKYLLSGPDIEIIQTSHHDQVKQGNLRGLQYSQGNQDSQDSQDIPYQPCEENWTTKYLNRPDVIDAIHVINSVNWEECSRTTKYELSDKMKSTIHIYRKLIEQKDVPLNMLIYSGDDDSVCATKYTNEWVYGLGYIPTTNWKTWVTPDGQVAGYETVFKVPKGNSFKFATVHGAGHEVPTYKPEEAYVLFNDWLGL